MYVECFESNNIWQLQQEINTFLNKKLTAFQHKVIDIKYNCISSHLPRTNVDDWNVLYTAMVMYQGEKVDE